MRTRKHDPSTHNTSTHTCTHARTRTPMHTYPIVRINPIDRACKQGSLGVVPANHLMETTSASMQQEVTAPSYQTAQSRVRTPRQYDERYQQADARSLNVAMDRGDGPPATPRSVSRSLNRYARFVLYFNLSLSQILCARP
jgi:hypothetical protein